jgi:GNAT superfamily N-acetyltransferase
LKDYCRAEKIVKVSPEFTLNHLSGYNVSGTTLSGYQNASGKIRPYKSTDRYAAEKIIREAEELLPFSHSLKQNIGRTIRHWLDQGYALASFYVVTVRSEISGLVGFTPMENIGYGEICQLQPFYLRPEVRGSGYGQQLLDHVINRAREVGYRRCYFEVSESLQEAVNLVESYGFYKLPSSITGNQGQDHTMRHYMKYIF